MKITNKSKLQEVANFIVKYEGTLEAYDDKMTFLDPTEKGMFRFTDNDFARACCKNICVYKANCDKLGITEEEIFGLIAHEIGHIVKKTFEEKEKGMSGIEAEKLADSMAAELGLGKELASALKKIRDSGIYKDLEGNLTTRIAELEHKSTANRLICT